MIHADRVIENRQWYTVPPSYTILDALYGGDHAHIETNTIIAFLHLGLPQEATNCQLRVRGNSEYMTPILALVFWLGLNPIATHVVQLSPAWEEVELAVPYWDEVEIYVDTDDYAAIDYLRGYPFGGLPTRRLLTGVGV